MKTEIIVRSEETMVPKVTKTVYLDLVLTETEANELASRLCYDRYWPLGVQPPESRWSGLIEQINKALKE